MSPLTYKPSAFRVSYVRIYIKYGGRSERCAAGHTWGLGCGTVNGGIMAGGLSGVFLVAFVPSLWWIFTTYFWVAFPAFGMLTSGIAGLGEGGPVRVSEEQRERELLEAIREGGEISAAGAAARSSLTVAEADWRLKELAENGHLEVRARGGAIFYAMWGDGQETARIEGST